MAGLFTGIPSLQPPEDIETLESLAHADLVSTLGATLSPDSESHALAMLSKTQALDCTITSFTLGTGLSLYTSTLLPEILSAREEVHLVTCFWANPCETLSRLGETLRELNKRHLDRISTQSSGSRLNDLENGHAHLTSTNGEERHPNKLRVRIYLSSTSLLRTLSHSLFYSFIPYLFRRPSSRKKNIYTYDSRELPKRLGLPDPERELSALDIKVKQRFEFPFGILHTKFLLVDGRRMVLPSANVSWEEWFEGAVGFEGREIVSKFAGFLREVWGEESIVHDEEMSGNLDPGRAEIDYHDHPPDEPSSAQPDALFAERLRFCKIKTTFLPSPHHPTFPPFLTFLFRFSSHSPTPPPPTPLNTYLLSLFTHAQTKIYVQTPNLTSPPVLSALLKALERGVNVEIVTSERLMVLEQLVTAGTTTKREVARLVKGYKKLGEEESKKRTNMRRKKRDGVEADLEQGLNDDSAMEDDISPSSKVGRLRVFYYTPLSHQNPPPQTRPSWNQPPARHEPVQSHLKLTIIDSQVVVLGSANMDRASWFTSQELGVAFHSTEFAAEVEGAVWGALRGDSGPCGDGANRGIDCRDDDDGGGKQIGRRRLVFDSR